MAQLGDLVVKIVGDTADFVRKVDQSGRRMAQFDRDMKKIAQSLTRAGRTLTMGVTLPILGLGAAAVKSAADLEIQSAAFETMLGSAEEAALMIQRLTDMAAMTPFQMTDLADGTKTLLAFGIEADNVLPILKELGDISLGDSERLKQLALVYGQVQSAGRLMGQDLLQLINVGFNPLQLISERTGETMAELKKRMEQGGISAEEVAEAFSIATAEGGLFFGGMERASQTLAGKFSTLKDNVSILGRSFADILMPALKDIVDAATRLVQKWSAMDDHTKRMILQYAGIAASIGPLLLAVGAAIKVFQTLRLATIALNAAMAANPAMAVAAGIAALVAGIALAIPAIQNIRRRNKEYEDQLYNTAEAVAELTDQEQRQLRTRFANEYAEALREQRRLIEDVAEATEREAEAHDAAATARGASARNAATLWQTASNNLTVAQGELAETEQRITDLETALDTLDEILNQEFEPEVDRSTTEVAELGDAADDTAGDVDTLSDAVWRLSGVIHTAGMIMGEDFGKQAEKAHEAVRDLRDSVEVLAKDTESTIKEAAQAFADFAEEGPPAVKEAIEEQSEAVEADATAWTQWEEEATGAVVSVQNAVARLAVVTEESAEQQKTVWEQFYEWYETNFIDRILDSTQAMTSALVDWANARSDAEIDAIERSLMSEEEKDAAILEIKQRQARRDKAIGIFNAVIDTAQAIIGFLANPGGIVGAIMSAAAGVTGAAQIGAIAAQPLPALAQGGIVTGPTQALIGEGGQPELILPLDQLGDLMSARGQFQDIGSGTTSVEVFLDGDSIMKYAGKASREGRLLIDARAVT